MSVEGIRGGGGGELKSTLPYYVNIALYYNIPLIILPELILLYSKSICMWL